MYLILVTDLCREDVLMCSMYFFLAGQLLASSLAFHAVMTFLRFYTFLSSTPTRYYLILIVSLSPLIKNLLHCKCVLKMLLYNQQFDSPENDHSARNIIVLRMKAKVSGAPLPAFFILFSVKIKGSSCFCLNLSALFCRVKNNGDRQLRDKQQVTPS